MTTANNEAWTTAVAEGLRFFSATLHVNPNAIRFVGQSWEDGGFPVDDDGNPRCDPRGNTIAKFSVEQLDANNPDHVAQVDEWYG